jgi:hypothetical protein
VLAAVARAVGEQRLHESDVLVGDEDVDVVTGLDVRKVFEPPQHHVGHALAAQDVEELIERHTGGQPAACAGRSVCEPPGAGP